MFTVPGPRTALRPRFPYVPIGLGVKAKGLSHSLLLELIEVRELSLPVMTLMGWPLAAWNSGATCQSLRSRLIHKLEWLTALVATRDTLKLCRVSKTHGPQSAWRLKGCELFDAARAAPKSESEMQ